jgi:hypothetical protein
LANSFPKSVSSKFRFSILTILSHEFLCCARFEMVIPGRLETVTSLKFNSMSQRSPDHMTIMPMQKVLTAAQKKLNLSEKAHLERALPLKPKVNVAPPHPKEEQADAFARVFLSDMLRNMNKPPKVRRFTAETSSPGFVIRAMPNQAYEFLRRLIPLPQIEHVDEYFKRALDAVELQMKHIQFSPVCLRITRISICRKVIPVE